MIDKQKNIGFLSRAWKDSILPSLSEYIRIPNKSPLFDPDWYENGYMHKAVKHAVDWVHEQQVDGLDIKVHELNGLTPTITLELAATDDSEKTILLYGHLDKQPEFVGWNEGLGPWEPVIKDDKLYGRGGADDGYAIYASVAAIQSLQDQKLPHPRLVVLIECSEESGSPDLPRYMEHLKSLIGDVSLVIALDSTCGNYDQLWITTSLRGIIAGKLKIEVLEQGAHSGNAGGVVPSSFMVLRQLLSRLEDENTGTIFPSFLNEQIPDSRLQEAVRAGTVLKESFPSMFSFKGQPLSSDPVDLVLNNTWRASLEITGIEGLPALNQAGNVLRPQTTAKISLRLPPSTDAASAGRQIKKLLTENPPFGASITLDLEEPSAGWHAPITHPELEESLESASIDYFGQPAVAMGCGGSIPFMQFLANQFPQAQFIVTGVLGPHSNAHGPNEFLHIPTAIKVSACIAQVIHDWAGK